MAHKSQKIKAFAIGFWGDEENSNKFYIYNPSDKENMHCIFDTKKEALEYKKNNFFSQGTKILPIIIQINEIQKRK